MNVVTHIELKVAGNRRSGIRKIYGHTGVGRWVHTEAEVIHMIWSQTHTFSVLGKAGVPARVIVAGAAPHLFLKTADYGVSENNLLALPEWPFAA